MITWDSYILFKIKVNIDTSLTMVITPFKKHCGFYPVNTEPTGYQCPQSAAEAPN